MKLFLSSIVAVFVTFVVGMMLFIANAEPEPLVFRGGNTELLKRTNTLRALHDLPNLAENQELNNIAMQKCLDMVGRNYFGHVDPDGNQVFKMMTHLSYLLAGENIAENYLNAADVTADWYASPSHKANIIADQFTEVGHATCESNNSFKVVQIFKG